MSQSNQWDNNTFKDKVKNGAMFAVSATVNGAKTAYDKTKEVGSDIIEKAKDSISSDTISNAANGTTALIYGGLAFSKESFSKILVKTGMKKQENNEEELIRYDRNLKESLYVPPPESNTYHS